MKRNLAIRLSLCFTLLFGSGMVSAASAEGADLGIGKTTLATVIVDGKGMTAYYYLPDVPNSGVSTCTGGCLVHWPAIISKTSTPVVEGVTAKVSVIPATNQILINGRPIYTFAGDQRVGDVNGQGVGGIWYVVSPAGVELNASVLVKENTQSSASATPTPSKSSAKPKAKIVKKSKPKKKKTTSNPYYGR